MPMESDKLTVTYIGGPTALLEAAGLRLLTDPTFDPPGGTYIAGPVTLRKLAGPTVSPDGLGQIDVVLLSHDHHFEGWAHFTESRETIARAFAAVSLGARLRWLQPGAPTVLSAEALQAESGCLFLGDSSKIAQPSAQA